MPIDDYFDKLFAENGDRTDVPDAAQPDGSVSYDQGYTSDYSLPNGDPSYKPIERDKWNDIIYQVTKAIQKYQQTGVPPFITSAMNNGSPFSYARNTLVLLDGEVYRSLKDTNTDTPPSANWMDVNQILIQFGAEPVAPAGLFNMDGINTFAKTSGAVNNGTQYQKLYVYLWNNYDNTAAPVITGRGLTAIADFNANKTITIPDRRGYTPMGVKAATPIASASAISGTLTVAASGTNSLSLNSFTITAATSAVLSYNVALFGSLSGGNIAIGNTAPAGVINGNVTGAITTNAGGGGITPTGSSTFTGSATSVLQPSAGVYWYINF